MKKIIGIIIIVVLALWGLIAINKETQEQKELPRNDLQEAVAYSENINLEDGDYIANTGDSFTGWKGKTVATQHNGTVYLKSGNIKIIDSEVSGNIIFDMSTIRSEIGLGLDDHLKSKDFFDISKYPETTIEITGYFNGEVQGELTIKDTVQPVSLPVNISQEDNNIYMNGMFELDRTLWDIVYNSSSILSDLGDLAINDFIEFEIEFIFIKENE
ncbi:MAG: polyisoprenoid-binding protein YceI [Crocinitomicaceae bacterium]|jgi:polyisoprenoid-binding protein YceI